MTTHANNIVVWERANKHGKWCPYSAEVCTVLEENCKKNYFEVCLGDVHEELKIYSVNLKDMYQISEATDTKLPIRRRLCDSLGALGRGFSWQWHDDHDVWITYDADVNDFIDAAFLADKKSVSLNRKFAGYPYEIIFSKMIQINKHSKRKPKVRRSENASPYPNDSPAEVFMDIDEKCSAPIDEVKSILSPEILALEVPGTADLLSQVNAYRRNALSSGYAEAILNGESMEDTERSSSKQMKYSDEQNHDKYSSIEQSSPVPLTTVALVNGKPWKDSWPPHTPRALLKPVPGVAPLPKYEKPKRSKKKDALKPPPVQINVLEKYTEVIDLTPEIGKEICIICQEYLNCGSAYNEDNTLSKLILCSHIFHKACLEAMCDNGNKQFLLCPYCQKHHGEKYGIQPPGEMVFHVLPYSLPGYPENDTIRIIYDIHPGIQGPEHPSPGKRYTARGFPRHCYLPDNEIGRKILRLLVKAWNRRLIFTIGQSSTTGEEGTVTWNEIHHKTEFGCNRRGHGYPDPNYFSNVLAELEAHGVVDDEVRVWEPV